MIEIRDNEVLSYRGVNMYLKPGLYSKEVLDHLAKAVLEGHKR